MRLIRICPVCNQTLFAGVCYRCSPVLLVGALDAVMAERDAATQALADIEKELRLVKVELARLKGPHTCIKCGRGVPAGQGLGFSGPESEWTDRSKSRPISVQPMCIICIGEHFAGY